MESHHIPICTMETEWRVSKFGSSRKCKVMFMKAEQMSCSIRVQLGETFAELHRLKKPLQQVSDALLKSPTHELEICTGVSEGVVVRLDGIDLIHLWDFLESKRVCSVLDCVTFP